jgi:hypothetical protein
MCVEDGVVKVAWGRTEHQTREGLAETRLCEPSAPSSASAIGDARGQSAMNITLSGLSQSPPQAEGTISASTVTSVVSVLISLNWPVVFA